MSFPLAYLLAATPLMIAAALVDVRRRRIPNPLNVTLGLTGLAAQSAAHGWKAALAALAVGAAVLIVLWLAWAAGALGGGDVKLAAATAIWVGQRQIAIWMLVAMLAGGVAALACYFLSSGEVRRQVRQNLVAAVRTVSVPAVPIGRTPGRVSVPYGAAFAVAGLLVLWTGMGGG